MIFLGTIVNIIIYKGLQKIKCLLCHLKRKNITIYKTFYYPNFSQYFTYVLKKNEDKCFFSAHSNERLFLRDFVNCVEGSSGGRLAQWLQPGSRVDPIKCQILYSREEFICGWSAFITVLTRDQYGDIVFVPNMKVEVKGMLLQFVVDIFPLSILN